MCCTIVSRITSRLGQTFSVFRQVSSDSLSFFFGYDLSIFPAIFFLRYFLPSPLLFCVRDPSLARNFHNNWRLQRKNMIYTIAHKCLHIWCNSIKMLILLLHRVHRKSWYKAKGIHPLYKSKSNTIWFNNQNDLRKMTYANELRYE